MDNLSLSESHSAKMRHQDHSKRRGRRKLFDSSVRKCLWKTAMLSLVVSSIFSSTLADSPAGEHQATRNREGFAIARKNCQVADEMGTCMFVWECLKTEGKHLGMCMDGFMFGSCCVHDEKDNQLSSEISNFPSKLPEQIISEAEQLIEKFDVDMTKINAETSEKYSSHPYKPTTSLPEISSENESDLWSSLPTRPSRPTKPTVRWPTFHTSTESPTTSTEHHGIVKFPVLATRPTKQPPPLSKDFPTKPTSKPAWSWEDRSSTTFSPETSTHTTSTTAVSANLYYPSTSSETDDPPQWTKRPTRPTRPPKPSSFELVTYFPPMNAEKDPFQEPSYADILLQAHIPTTSTTPTTTTPMSTTTTTTATTSTAVQVPTARPPIHSMPPPRFSSDTFTTPAPPSSPAISAQPTGGCGVPTITKSCPKGRIVNGTQSCYGQFPWQVSVRRTSFFGFSSTHRCGGALINELWVATAGHCVDDLLIAKIRVRIGEWDFASTSEPEGYIEMKVVEKIVHPKYNFFTYEYDLALIKLEKRISFKENMIPICLPGNDDSLVGEVGVVAGWGRLSEGGKLPNILQYVSVPIVSNTRCKEMFLRAGRHEVIPEIFMCAGYDSGGRDSCQGDSGGPLIVKGKDGRYFLGGIISWGIGCAEPNLPGVCTRISKFTDWILDHVT